MIYNYNSHGYLNLETKGKMGKDKELNSDPTKHDLKSKVSKLDYLSIDI